MCNKNCNQGRNCDCGPPPVGEFIRAMLQAVIVCAGAVLIVSLFIPH